MSERLTPIEIKTRRENLNLSVKEICKIFRLDEATWNRWETIPTAPYFFGFAFSYLEENFGNFKPKPKEIRVGHNTKKPFNLSFRGRFLAKTEKAENSDCLLWTGAKSIRLEDGKSFASPRQAAWIVAHGEKPAGEIKLICETQNCVNTAHFQLNPTRSAGRKFISDNLKNLIRFELQKPNPNQKEIAKRFNISTGTVSRIANE